MISIDSVWPEWHVEELIGQGSYGRVYRISRESMGHVSYAAAKMIDIPHDESEVSALASMGMDNLSIRAYFENTAQGIINEIAVMESLKGARNVVSIEDYRLIEREDGIGWTIWIRMELLEDLVSYQLRHGAPSVGETVQIGIDICNALECCHGLGVIHRDVKPENVFRSKFGEYKLGDFGISKQMETATRTTFSRKGTTQYMAPEVAREEKYDRRADVYSLGMMLYRYLNELRFPFAPLPPDPVTPADMQESLLRRMGGERLPAPRDADEGLAEIVLRACEADPGRRYPSAGDLMRDLERWRDGAYRTVRQLAEERLAAERREREQEEKRARDREALERERRRVEELEAALRERDGRGLAEGVPSEGGMADDDAGVGGSGDSAEDDGEEGGGGRPVDARRLLAYSFLLLLLVVAVAFSGTGFSSCAFGGGRTGPNDGGAAESASEKSSDEYIDSAYVGEWFVPTDTDRYIYLRQNGTMSYGDSNHGVIASGKWAVIDESANAIKFTLKASGGYEGMFEEGAGEFTRMAHVVSSDKMTAQLYYSASEWETYIRQ